MARIIRADRSGSPVIPGPVADARQQARGLIERAEREADAIRDRAREQGLEQGRAEASRLLTEAAAVRDRALQGSEDEVIEIAMAAARRILGENLILAPEGIATIVSPVLASARRARRLALRVHPAGVEALHEAVEALTTREGVEGAVAIEPDDSITRGGCLLVTDIGSFDARLEVQLEELARALRT